MKRKKKMRILVVDDDEIQRISLQDDLREAGYDSTAVESPKVALELVSKERFDVAVSDLKMPDMDGWIRCSRTGR